MFAHYERVLSTQVCIANFVALKQLVRIRTNDENV